MRVVSVFFIIWGCSSIGRASDLHSEGCGIVFHQLHNYGAVLVLISVYVVRKHAGRCGFAPKNNSRKIIWQLCLFIRYHGCLKSVWFNPSASR